ncbi:hypothetical protein LFL96_23225 [Paraburkholderia sp. D15]|uniref:hypothetical protein n=1 Tax=Paraburkholderia sp. D15 TaxID=2880218 RepID=UPI0024798B60|nr:hypothetical protein [Paraburkholderia sp. D15]WGS53953.1 hypothetical protein LFL96_23225 [Paraburkholderia sp. D15]
MNDLSSLQDALSGWVTAASRFVLDNRSTGQLLQSFHDYAALIPFDDQHSWADVYFNGGATPASLAALFDDPSVADGELPPHQAFMLGFLDLLRTPRAILNYFPAAHRELYYRGLLGVSEKPAEPDSVVLGFTLKDGVAEQMVSRGTLFDGGQDTQGTPIRYALDDSLLVNRGIWSDLRWCQPAAADAPAGTQISDVLFDASESIEWPKNGMHLFADSRQPQTVPTGRVVGSTLLAMPAGTRTISLTFGSAIAVGDLAVVQISAGDQWIALSGSVPDSGDPSTLAFAVPAMAPAISPPTGENSPSSSTPLLKLGRSDGQPVPEITALAVSATGSSDVVYGTDDGADRLDGLSYPFGQTPVVGSGFDLIAAQWCGLGVPVTLTLTPQWIDLPDVSFPAWYANYPGVPADNDSFKVQPLCVSPTGSMKLEGTTTTGAQPSGTDALSLFQSGAESAPAGNTLTIELPAGLAGAERDSPDPRDWPQWIRLELSGMDFLHQEYDQLVGTADVNPPYTPQINGMTVSYSATAADITQSVLTPFGVMQNDDPAQTSPDKLHLYLGFSDNQPEDTLSLYWQLQSPAAQVVSWQYLNAGNQWIALDDTLVDSTQGLLGSGLWTAILPADASAEAGQMPAGRYWVRGLIEPVASTDVCSPYVYPTLSGIETNSMTATLSNAENLDVQHFTRPLPAGTIQNAVTPLTAIEQVSQPWPSFGGAPPELPGAFFERIASRLNHRNRALTWVDVQALLKEKYPSVFGIGIPSVDTTFSLPAPVQQVAVVIPVSGMKDNGDPLRPALSEVHLTDMADYLGQLASPWADIVLRNPTYRTVMLDYDVTYKTGVNPAYAQRQLTQALEARYMPWSWDQRAGVTLGNSLDYYAIVAFIQWQPYVRKVDSLTLDGARQSVHASDGEVLILGAGAGTLLPSTDRSGRS